MQRAPNEYGLALAALRPMMSSRNTDPTNPPNPSELLAQPPGGGHAPRTPTLHQRQGRRRGPDTDLFFGGSQTRGTHGLADDHRNVIKKLSRTLLSRARGQGIRAPLEPTRTSSKKVKRQGTRSQDTRNCAAGVASAHVTCENGERDTFPAAQKANSVKEREGGLDSEQHSFFPPDPYPEHARDPQARWLLPANTGVLRRAQPAAPDGRPDTRARARPP